MTSPRPDAYTLDDQNPVPDQLAPAVIVPPKDDPELGDPPDSGRTLAPEEERPKQDEDEGTFGE